MFGTNSVRFGRESEKKERKKESTWSEIESTRGSTSSGRKCPVAEAKMLYFGPQQQTSEILLPLSRQQRAFLHFSFGLHRSSENQSSPLSWLVVSSARLRGGAAYTHAHLLSFLLSVKSLTAASFFSQTTHSRWCFRARQRANTSQSTTIVARKPFFMRLPRLSPRRIPKETRRARDD